MSPKEPFVALARSAMSRLLPNTRAMKIALLALGAGLAATVATGGASAWLALKSRRRLDQKIAALEQQLALDRRQRLRLERDIAEERRRAVERRQRSEGEVSAQIAALRGEEQHLRQQLEEARAHATLSTAQLTEMQGRLQETKRQITALDTERSLAERIIRKYQAGVGFVAGTWSWRDASGRPARYASVDAHGDPQRDSGGVPVLSSDGAGPPVASQFVGTGFLVSRDGLLLTNRHIAEPWWREKDARALEARGFTPHLDELNVYFPGVENPMPLTVASLSKSNDVALARVDLKGLKLPVVEMEPEPEAATAGQSVVILGYPTGLDALLARIDDPVADSIVAKAHGDWDKVARELSRRRMIRPLATQGHLSDVLETQLVYDALTAQGGSGGPVFNSRGRVIGLTAAAMTDFAGATFGVPIRFGLDLFPTAPGRKKEARTRSPG